MDQGPFKARGPTKIQKPTTGRSNAPSAELTEARVRQEKEGLRESEATLRTFINALTDPALLLDFVNESLTRDTRISPSGCGGPFPFVGDQDVRGVKKGKSAGTPACDTITPMTWSV